MEDKLKWPSIGLIAVGALNILFYLLFIVLFAVVGIGEPSGHYEGTEQITSRLLMSALLFVFAIPSVLIMYGARKMMNLESYSWSITAAGLSVLPCATNPMAVFIFPVAIGAWSIYLLLQDSVKNEFPS
ncbi:MAG: hypothetical protein ABEJ65_06535 [bacterium]